MTKDLARAIAFLRREAKVCLDSYADRDEEGAIKPDEQQTSEEWKEAKEMLALADRLEASNSERRIAAVLRAAAKGYRRQPDGMTPKAVLLQFDAAADAMNAVAKIFETIADEEARS